MHYQATSSGAGGVMMCGGGGDGGIGALLHYIHDHDYTVFFSVYKSKIQYRTTPYNPDDFLIATYTLSFLYYVFTIHLSDLTHRVTPPPVVQLPVVYVD